MIEFYGPIRAVHIGAVAASGSLFALRGLASFGGARWPQHIGVRLLSWSVDTVLLTAALMLWTMLPGALFANHWLAVKLVLLVVYIALANFALRRAQTQRARALGFALALAVFAWIIGVARTHDPLGWLARI